MHQQQVDSNRQVNHTLLHEASKIIVSSAVTTQKIEAILQLLSRWANLYFPRILLPNYQTKELEVTFNDGLDKGDVIQGKYNVPFTKGLTGYVWKTGQVALVTDVLNESVFLTRIAEPIQGSLHHVGFLSVPILVQGKTIGVLSAQRRANPRRRYSDDVDLLRIIATLLGPELKRIQRRAHHISFTPDQLDKESGRRVVLCESHGIIGSSRTLLAAVKEVEQVKDSDAPVLLLGESGTGKEMFAGLLHRESKRKKNAYICINCASIPEALLESELFGHEKGSFTGAFKKQIGKIEQADGGTLFLDEIGDMPMDLQVKLLRVLQEKQIQPVGSQTPRPVDFRLITATHIDLSKAVADGKFRLDLFYRLNVIPISLPPLRERKEDIPILAQHFLSHYCQEYDRSINFTQGVYEILKDFDWPGNIRQLQNVVERAVLKADGPWIGNEEINFVLTTERALSLEAIKQIDSHEEDSSISQQQIRETANSDFLPTQRPYSHVQTSELNEILTALEKTKGNQTRAAKLLGYTPRQLRYRLKKLSAQ